MSIATQATNLEDGLLPFNEVLRTLGCSRQTVLRKVRRGELPAPIRIGSRLAFRRADIVGWIRQQPAAWARPAVRGDW